jgi:hypothetical protein
LFAPVIAPLIEALEPRTMLEIGAGEGRLTKRLLDAPGGRDAVLHAVDPSPRLDPRLTKAAGERLVVHAERAISAIGRVGAVDLALLDGDPNWYSVHSELTMLAQAAERAERPAPLAVVHDIHWPFGRRDGYYDPAVIPAAQRREHSDLGLVPGQREPDPNGLRFTPFCASIDFEPRSGVLSAVEDAIAGSDLEWTVLEVPGFHGAAVVVEARLPARLPALAAVLEGLRSTRFLHRQVRRAESARLAAELELTAANEASATVEDELEAAAEGPVEHPLAEAAEPPPVGPEPDPAGESERVALLAEAAEHRAHREALEWRVERLGEDLASQAGQLDALTTERDAERKASLRFQARLENATQSLEADREAKKELGERIAELEKQADLRARELREVSEREQLAQGRLAHREDALQAADAERERLEVGLDELRTELRAADALREEIAEHLRRASSSRRARIGRRVAALGRAMTFRRQVSPSYLESARAAAERALPVPAPRPAPRDPRDRTPDELEASRELD